MVMQPVFARLRPRPAGEKVSCRTGRTDEGENALAGSRSKRLHF